MEKVFTKYLSVFILAAGVALALAFGEDIRTTAYWMLRSLYERQTLELVLIIYLVLLLGEILAEKKSLVDMIAGFTGILRKKALIIAFAPAFIGLLPMPGGALVSAPILDETLGEAKVSPELKTFTNYWFRHIWEYMWPLYPGLILTAAVFGVEITAIIRTQFYFTLIAAAVGALSLRLYYRRFGDSASPPGSFTVNMRRLLAGSWEILLVVLLIAACRIDMTPALALSVMLSLLLLRADGPGKIRLLARSFKLPVLAVLVAVMIFKNLIIHSEVAAVIESLTSHAETYGTAVMFSIPFLIGLLTGVNQAYAGIAFPILLPVVGVENPDLRMIAFLYISGFAGVLLSPVHLCLVLSAEYYGANLAKVFRYLFPPVLILVLLALTIYGM